MSSSEKAPEPKNPIREIVQPFIDLVHAPRALWGINVTYLLEGLAYFGVLNYLAIYFSDFVFKGVEHPDVWSHNMVMVLTAGITIAMFFLGFVCDKWGVRRALILALLLLIIGRSLMAGAPTVLKLQPSGPWSALHLMTMLGILFVVVGYGMYQPSAYAAVRRFTTPKTAGMAFAMLYALMNLGGYINSAAFLVRDDKYLGLGIPGTYWVYTGLTVVGLLCTVFILSTRTAERATAQAKAESEELAAASGKEPEVKTADEVRARAVMAEGAVELSATAWAVIGLILLGLSCVFCFIPLRHLTWPHRLWGIYVSVGLLLIYALLPAQGKNAVRKWLKYHPLTNKKFAFFVFSLMPVQTLFTYNWFILPQYVSRCYTGWIGEYYEIASNLNALLVFVFAPILAALTQKRKVYNMMIVGTFIMAAPAFLPAIGTSPLMLFGYILFMTIGESIWQPRFLQYAAQIAPEGRTGEYMGVAQLPWFMTKMLVPLLYSGRIMDQYCPPEGFKDPQTMWLIFGCIAMGSCILLMLARPWVGKDFKTRA